MQHSKSIKRDILQSFRKQLYNLDNYLCVFYMFKARVLKFI